MSDYRRSYVSGGSYYLTDNMGVYMPSMYLDYQNKRPMEVKEIYWRPIKAAEAKGVAIPVARSIAEALDDLQVSTGMRNNK